MDSATDRWSFVESHYEKTVFLSRDFRGRRKKREVADTRVTMRKRYVAAMGSNQLRRAGMLYEPSQMPPNFSGIG